MILNYIFINLKFFLKTKKHIYRPMNININTYKGFDIDCIKWWEKTILFEKQNNA